ncbi:hypothetical protein ScPMuIL_013823 [Solemya velum]
MKDVKPGFTGESHPEIFTVAPPQPKEKKPGQMSPEQVKEFFDDGFTHIENIFTDEELQPSIDALKRIVDELAQKLYKAGKIKNLHEDHGFESRLTMLEQEWEGAVLLAKKQGKMNKGFQDLWSNEKLLNAVEQLLGPDIAAGSIWQPRPKIPNHLETSVPMHQDSGYFDHDSYSALVITAWIPFVDTNKENGCMEFVVGGHRKGIVGRHKMRAGNAFYIEIDDKEIKETLGVDAQANKRIVEVKKGGVLLFSNMIPHRSLPNTSNMIRWSLDVRFQRPDRPFGFWGLKNGVTLRSSKDPLLEPDWDTYNAQDRFKNMKDYENERLEQKDAEGDEFDTTLTAPYFEKWEIEGTNRHVESYFGKKK